MSSGLRRKACRLSQLLAMFAIASCQSSAVGLDADGHRQEREFWIEFIEFLEQGSAKVIRSDDAESWHIEIANRPVPGREGSPIGVAVLRPDGGPGDYRIVARPREYRHASGVTILIPIDSRFGEKAISAGSVLVFDEFGNQSLIQLDE